MYYSDFIKVNNARIPREQIIKQLSRITPDTIEFMMKKMLENTGSMSNEVGYAIACLYNAIDGIDIDVTLTSPEILVTRGVTDEIICIRARDDYSFQ